MAFTFNISGLEWNVEMWLFLEKGKPCLANAAAFHRFRPLGAFASTPLTVGSNERRLHSQARKTRKAGEKPYEQEREQATNSTPHTGFIFFRFSNAMTFYDLFQILHDLELSVFFMFNLALIFPQRKLPSRFCIMNITSQDFP